MKRDLHAWLRAIAGTVILISLGLASVHSPAWLWLTAFVGVNLVQSAVTGWCPMMVMLRKAGVRS